MYILKLYEFMIMKIMRRDVREKGVVSKINRRRHSHICSLEGRIEFLERYCVFVSFKLREREREGLTET